MKLRFLVHSVFGAGGGVVRVVLNLVDDLKARHDVELVSVFQHHDEPTHIMPSGVPLTVLVDARESAPRTGPEGLERQEAESRPSLLIPPREPRYAAYSRYSDSQLTRYLGTVDDGVLIGMQPGVTAAIAQLARPSVVTVGQDHMSIRGRSSVLREQVLPYYAKLDTFLTLTERDAEVYRKRYLPTTPVVAMPNGIPEYHGAVSDGTSKVVVAVGRLSKGKGFDRLVEAWATVVKRHPDWQLRMYGEGDRRDALTQQIEELGVSSSASLMGYSTTVRDEMAKASLLVLSSRTEGYPMSILEAMSCGLPVVAFDCHTGPREMIDHGTDGLLVPNGDIDGLADAISRVIELGIDGRRAMGQAALRKARQHSQPVISARWESLLRQLLDAKAAQARAPR